MKSAKTDLVKRKKRRGSHLGRGDEENDKKAEKQAEEESGGKGKWKDC